MFAETRTGHVAPSIDPTAEGAHSNGDCLGSSPGVGGTSPSVRSSMLATRQSLAASLAGTNPA